MASPMDIEGGYQLSSVFGGHKQDVRAVTSFVDKSGDVFVVTGSRDSQVRVWKPYSKKEDPLVKTFIGHEHFVASLTVLPENNSFLPGTQCIASGSNDKTVIIWDIETSTQVLTLIGHEDTVSCLDYTRNDENGCLLITGSWDKTVRIWKSSNCIGTIKGHSLAIWAVISIDSDNTIVSGSADKTIKIWKKEGTNYRCATNLTKHTDCVRSLCLVKDIGFVSCGNDGVLYLWSNNGECLQEFNGHTSFVYSVSVILRANGPTFISGGEDRAIKVWRNGECEETLMHPGTVWSVSNIANNNGDIVSGCSDGVARVWTKDPTRKASSEEITLYQNTLASQAIPSGTVGDIQADKLPGLEALQTPGTKDQQNKIIRNGNQVELYQWSNSDQQWMKVGEVVDAKNSSKQMLHGKQYDYVFDVDVGDGKMMKIGYNNGENPYMVAQQFIWDNELQQEWLDQIAQFITANTKNVVIGSDQSLPQVNNPVNKFYDPFTGSGRYVPGTESIPSHFSKPTQPQQPKPTPQPQTYKHLPVKDPITFSTANHQTILKKALEFNTQLSQQNNSLALNKSEEDQLSRAVNILSETSKYATSTIDEADFNLFFSKLINWPEAQRFPVLDILRLLVLHPDGANKLKNKKDLVQEILNAGLSTTSTPPNQMLALRFISNMFHASFISLLSERENILERVADVIKSDNKNVRLAALSLLINYGIFVNSFDASNREGTKLQSAGILGELVNSNIETEEENIYRALAAIGTLVWNDKEGARLVNEMEMRNFLETNTKSNSQRVKEISQEIISHLQTYLNFF